METEDKANVNITMDREDAERLDKIRDKLKTKTRPETIRAIMNAFERGQ